MPSQLFASRLLSARATRLFLAAATVFLLGSSMRLIAQGGPCGINPCLPSPPVTAHFSYVRSTIGSSFSYPSGISVDAQGNVYIADAANYRIIKETLSGGTYTQSVILTADPTLNYWYRVVVDGAGNLYIVDSQANNVLKETLANGTYTKSVIPTTTLDQPGGVAVDAAGNVYIADGGNNRVLKETLSGASYTETTIGTALTHPGDVAVDSKGNVYIADQGSSRILKETLAAGTYTQTLINTGYSYPGGVSVDANGVVYVSDSSNNRILVETPSGSGYVGSVLIGGLFSPSEAVVDSQGTVYVAGHIDNTIYKLRTRVDFGPQPVGSATPVTSLTFTFDTAGSIGTPSVVTQGATGLDFADAGTGTCNTNGVSHSYAAGDTCTVDVTFTPDAAGLRTGAVVLNDTSNNALATGSISGIGLGSIPTFVPGTIDTSLVTLAGASPFPTYMASDAAGNLYVLDPQLCEVEKYTGSTQQTTVVAGTGTCGAETGIPGPANLARLTVPQTIVVNGRGDLYIGDSVGSAILKVDALTQNISRVAGTGVMGAPTLGPAVSSRLGLPTALALDASGVLYFSDTGLHQIFKVDASGTLSLFAGNGTSGNSGDGSSALSAEFSTPIAMAVDALGNVYFSDSTTNSIRKITTSTGIITKVAGTGTAGYSGDGNAATGAQLNYPAGMVFDPAGNLYMAEAGNSVIREVTTDGVIHTLAGIFNNNMGGYTGDGGPANAATLSAAGSLALDSGGVLHITDTYNQVIRVIYPYPTLKFGSFAVNTSSPAIDIALTNTGNTPLTLTGIDVDPAFNLQGADTSCSSSSVIAPGANCILGIEFLPTTVGSIKGRMQAYFSGSLIADTKFGLNGTGTPQLPTQVAVSGLPTAVGSGGNLGTLTADIEDANGGVVTASTASVTVTITGPGGYSQVVPATAVAGVATVNLAAYALTTPGTYTITTTSTGLATSTQTVTVAGPATQIAVAPLPTAVLAGGNLGTETATLKDGNGNPATLSTATVTATITGPNGFSQVVTGTAVNGVVSLNLSGIALTAPGTYTVTTTSANLPAATSTITVSGPATQVAVTGLPASVSPGGSLGTVTATLMNSTGGVAAASSGTVTTTITGPGGYSQTVTGTTVNGVATLNLGGLPAPTAVGTYTVTTTNSLGLPPVSSTFSVSAAPTKIGVTGLPATSVAFGGNLGTVTATLLNASNGVATSGSAVVTATITGPGGFSQVVTGVTVNGVVSLNLSGIALTAPGTYTVTVTSPNLASSVSTITVAAPASAQPAQLAVTGLAAAVGQSGNLGKITASVETSTGSVVTTSTAPVTLTITGPGGYAQTVTVAAVAGVAGFDLSGYSFPALGTYTLTVASPGLPVAAYSFNVAQDFTLAPAGTSAAGGGAAAAPSQTVTPGAPATYALTLAPAGVSFTQPITLSATGLPPGATYSFNPPIVTPGPAAATSTLTVTTANTVALQHHRGGLTGLVLAALLLPFRSRRMRKAARRLSAAGVLLALLSLGALTALSGCGAGGLYGHSPQSYVITVTAKSGAFSHSTTVMLTEQ